MTSRVFTVCFYCVLKGVVGIRCNFGQAARFLFYGKFWIRILSDILAERKCCRGSFEFLIYQFRLFLLSLLYVLCYVLLVLSS